MLQRRRWSILKNDIHSPVTVSSNGWRRVADKISLLLLLLRRRASFFETVVA